MATVLEIRRSAISAGVDLGRINFQSRNTRGLNVLRQRLENALWKWCTKSEKSFAELADIRRALRLVEDEIKSSGSPASNISDNNPMLGQLSFSFK